VDLSVYGVREKHLRPYKPNIHAQIVKNSPIRYWGRKPPFLIQKFIERYSRPGDIVADLFGGSGSIVNAALSLGRKAIYIDLNPYACLITDALLSPCRIDLLQQIVEKLFLTPEIAVKFNGKRKHLKVKDIFSILCECGRPVEFSSVTFDRKYVFTTKKEIPKVFLGFFKGTDYAINHTELLNYLKPNYHPVHSTS
jgi:hypothetical protein